MALREHCKTLIPSQPKSLQAESSLGASDRVGSGVWSLIVMV